MRVQIPMTKYKKYLLTNRKIFLKTFFIFKIGWIKIYYTKQIY